MSLIRTILVGTLVAAGLVLTTAIPAGASEQPTGIVPTATSVTGEPWSAPSFPVTCDQSSSQVSCTPDDPAQIKAQQCFLNVIVDGQRTSVCTTYEDHATAIQSMGGKTIDVQYGCSLGDVVCLTFENAGRGMALAATGAMFLVADNMRFDTSTLLWTAAVGEWSFWQWAILMILFGAMVWAIAAAVVSGDRSELVGALVRSFIAIPAVPISLWLTGHVLNAVDEMTWYIMNRDGPFALYTTLQSVMWAGGRANYFFGFLIHGLLLLGVLLLMLVFAFRNVVLAALIMVGPIAWMMFPVRGLGPQWVVRYISAVAVLLLTGPLTIGFVTLIINGLAGVKSIWDPQSWPLLVGLVLVAFAPFAIFGLFSFAGAIAADGVGSRLGSHAGRMAGNAARSVSRIPTRMGGSPSGVRSGHGSPSTPSNSSKPGGRATSAGSPRGASAPAQGRASGQGGGAQSTAISTALPGQASPPPAAPSPSKPASSPTDDRRSS